MNMLDMERELWEADELERDPHARERDLELENERLQAELTSAREEIQRLQAAVAELGSRWDEGYDAGYDAAEKDFPYKY